MSDIKKLVHELEFGNLKVKDIFEIIDSVIMELDGATGDKETVLKILNHVATLTSFGEQQTISINDNISKIDSCLNKYSELWQ